MPLKIQNSNFVEEFYPSENVHLDHNAKLSDMYHSEEQEVLPEKQEYKSKASTKKNHTDRRVLR